LYLKSHTIVCLPGRERLRGFPAGSLEIEQVPGEGRLALQYVQPIAAKSSTFAQLFHVVGRQLRRIQRDGQLVDLAGERVIVDRRLGGRADTAPPACLSETRRPEFRILVFPFRRSVCWLVWVLCGRLDRFYATRLSGAASIAQPVISATGTAVHFWFGCRQFRRI
jgi:hypothetical protein